MKYKLVYRTYRLNRTVEGRLTSLRFLIKGILKAHDGNVVWSIYHGSKLIEGNIKRYL